MQTCDLLAPLPADLIALLAVERTHEHPDNDPPLRDGVECLQHWIDLNA